jgi:hypothetical protein
LTLPEQASNCGYLPLTWKYGRMAVIEVRFKLEKETKGALRYQEIDDKGEVVEQAWAKIGTLYLRKSAFERGAAFPQFLRVTVTTGS